MNGIHAAVVIGSILYSFFIRAVTAPLPIASEVAAHSFVSTDDVLEKAPPNTFRCGIGCAVK